jgi:hypothetical protein
MREFNGKLSTDLDLRIRREAAELFEMVPEKREVRGSALLMDQGDEIVLREITIKAPGAGTLQIAATSPSARPPFEWLMEITSKINDDSYFKHYLILEDKIVLAHRKELTPIDDREAAVVLTDLAIAREAFLSASAGRE